MKRFESSGLDISRIQTRHVRACLVILFMPIYFVLGQYDVQSSSRHDNEVSTDLLRGAGIIYDSVRVSIRIIACCLAVWYTTAVQL